MTSHLPLRHLAVTLAVVAVWGTNFVVIRLALDELPPLLLATLRFTLAFAPAAFFLPRPDVPWRYLAAYGLFIGVGQFGLLFIAMERNITPGLASVVVQMQVFFTIALFMWRNGERLQGFQWVALLLGICGIGVIMVHTGGDTTPLGVLLVLGAGLAWTAGNFASKLADPPNMLSFIVWSSLFSAVALFFLSLGLEGWSAMKAGVEGASLTAWTAVLWQSVGNTLFGYGVWAWLLQRHPAATVTPLALLVPVFGMTASALLLGEALPVWKLAAAALIISGLAVGILYPFWRSSRAPAEPGLRS